MHIRGIQRKIKGKIALWLQLERRASPESEPYLQKIYYETEDFNATVATALSDIDSREFRDENGKAVEPIRWECSCLQKKCGACAMVINGVPRLACDCFLRDYKKQINIGPLHKFPVVADLIVDRGVLFSNLKTMEKGADGEAQIKEKDTELVYDSARCLQCGCCLEVCPNFRPGEAFYGAAGFVPAAGLLASLPKEGRKKPLEEYRKHAFAGCGKSLACQNICPANIDIEHLLVHSNQIALWESRRKVWK